ncbi:MAG: dienelactone hydrolase family protein [Hyphomicrobiaceae bacterium]
MHDAIPSEWFAGPWPRSVPLQIHTAEHDPWVDLDEARALAYEAGGTLFLYPGSGHLFADPGLPDYDRASAELMLSRVLAFIAGL